MTEPWVYLNGTLLPESRATVSVLDRGFLYGDGAFETMRSYDGRIFAFDRHAERLFRTLDVLRFSIPETAADLARAAHDLLRKNEMRDAVVRITITRGAVAGPLGLPAAITPTRIIVCRPLPPLDNESGVAAIIAKNVFAKTPILGGIKSLNYLDNLIAKQEARDRGAFEALLANAAGRIVEGASSNVFAVFGDEIRPPPLASGALPGVTRSFCIDILRKEIRRVRQTDIACEDLFIAGEVIITHRVVEILPVVKIDGGTIGSGRPGPVCQLLRNKYAEMVKREIES